MTGRQSARRANQSRSPTSASATRRSGQQSMNNAKPAASAATGRTREAADQAETDGKAQPGAHPPSSLVTVAYAAHDTGLSQRHVRRLVATGQLRVVRFGRAVRIPRSELERLAEARD